MRGAHMRAACVLPFVAVGVMFAFLYAQLQDRDSMYFYLLREDGILEYATAIFFVLSAVASFLLFYLMTKQRDPYRYFFLGFGLFCVFLTLEEVSWGQRLLGIQPGEFFEKHNAQNETNFHNILEKYLRVSSLPITETRQIGALILFIYGVILPIIHPMGPLKRFFRRWGVVIPQRSLILGFALGAVLCLFEPVTMSEELGEFFFSLAFFLLVLTWLLPRWPLRTATDSRATRELQPARLQEGLQRTPR